MNYKWLTWIILAVLLTISLMRDQRVGYVNKPAHMFSAKLLDGQVFNLKEHQGQVVVLDFWATWCAPCRISLPALSQVAADYADDPDVWVGSVNRENLSSENLRRFLDRLKLKFPVIHDQIGSVSRQYDVRGLPTLIVINPAGKITYAQAGIVSRHTPVLVRHLKKLIEEARSGSSDEQ